MHKIDVHAYTAFEIVTANTVHSNTPLARSKLLREMSKWLPLHSDKSAHQFFPFTVCKEGLRLITPQVQTLQPVSLNALEFPNQCNREIL